MKLKKYKYEMFLFYWRLANYWDDVAVNVMLNLGKSIYNYII